MATNRKRKPRAKYQPCGDTLTILFESIDGVFGEVTEMLWPDDVKAVQRWLKAERDGWSFEKGDPNREAEKAAFASVNAFLLGQLSAARAYQRRQLSLPL